MKNSLVMRFSLDKENKKIKVEREFAAPLEKVWAAWTKASYSTNGGHQNPIRLKPNQWTSERDLLLD